MHNKYLLTLFALVCLFAKIDASEFGDDSDWKDAQGFKHPDPNYNGAPKDNRGISPVQQLDKAAQLQDEIFKIAQKLLSNIRIFGDRKFPYDVNRTIINNFRAAGNTVINADQYIKATFERIEYDDSNIYSSFLTCKDSNNLYAELLSKGKTLRELIVNLGANFAPKTFNENALTELA